MPVCGQPIFLVAPAAVCDARQQAGIVGELRGVLEGESGGAFTVSPHDQRRDLDDLALTPCVRTGVSLRAGDVLLRRSPVAALRGDKGQEGVLDRRHGRRMRRAADSRLTWR